MLYKTVLSFLCVVLAITSAAAASAQHLWWDTANQKDATCLYGEITVLATHWSIYYCGANWHPGQAAGGYCGIQDNGPTEKRTIFSIWDTSPALHPQVTQADGKTLFNRFGNEGSGAHTHMLWNWHEGDTFQFFVQKQPGAATSLDSPNTTDASYYIFDPAAKAWRHIATITSPNGDKKQSASVTNIGGDGLASFLENFGGKERDVPKLALYRLWLGPDVDHLKSLTAAHGDGTWGQLYDCYFLAEGDPKKLSAVFDRLKQQYGSPTIGEAKKKLDPISDRPLSTELKQQLHSLPQAETISGK